MATLQFAAALSPGECAAGCQESLMSAIQSASLCQQTRTRFESYLESGPDAMRTRHRSGNHL
jgi:hypothetical protein